MVEPLPRGTFSAIGRSAGSRSGPIEAAVMLSPCAVVDTRESTPSGPAVPDDPPACDETPAAASGARLRHGLGCPWRQRFQARTARVTLWPPKPKRVGERHVDRRASTAAFGAQSRSHSGSGVDWLIVGGISPVRGGQQRRRRTRARRRRRAGARSSTWWSRRSASGRASPKTALTACGLGDVAQRRRGAVGVDVVHVAPGRCRRRPGTSRMARCAPSPSRGRRGDVVGVAASAP